MKGGTLQIVWHDALPVLSLDFDSETGLLATAGADHDIKLWAVLLKEEGKGSPTVSFKANLAFHTTAVNIIRFSPSGELLASGADGGHLAVWKRAVNAEGVATWKILKPLSFHPKDVLDLEWSPDGTFLISGSVDNSCIIWNVAKGAPLQVLKDHLHYVQGVAWDPTGQYVATVSGDRTCRIYSPRAAKGNSKAQEKSAKDGLLKFVCQHVLAKVSVRTSEDVPMQVEDADIPATKTASSSKQHLFHDENLPTFFRRLAWSPEGSFLLIPAGIYKPTADAGPFNTTCVVSRKDLSRPCLQLPCGKKAVVAVRFCPVIFTLRSNVETGTSPDTDGGVFRLPYRMVFAVATLNSLYIYDTQSDSPVLVFAALHYSAITDLAWSANAKFLAASSQDGYCTLLGFDEGELGDPMPLTAIPPHIASYLPEARRRKLAGTLGELSSPKQDSAAVESSQQAKATDTKAEPDALLNKQQPPVGNQFQGPATMAQPKSQITPVCDPKASEADVRAEPKSRDTDLTLVKKPRRVTPVPIKDGL